MPGKVQKVQKVSLINRLWRCSPSLINVTTTAAAKVKTVSGMRMVQMEEVVSFSMVMPTRVGRERVLTSKIYFLQSRYVKVRVSKRHQSVLTSLQQALSMEFQLW